MYQAHQTFCPAGAYSLYKSILAESRGFEPLIPLTRDTRFPSVRFQPLTQLSQLSDLLYLWRKVWGSNPRCPRKEALKFSKLAA